jgi:hypothetical protein
MIACCYGVTRQNTATTSFSSGLSSFYLLTTTTQLDISYHLDKHYTDKLAAMMVTASCGKPLLKQPNWQLK